MSDAILRVKGFVFFLTLFIAVALYSVFLLAIPAALLLVLPHSWNGWLHRWNGFVAACWYLLASAYIELVAGTKIVLSGDAVPSGERALLLCNHRSRVDWMFVWNLLSRTQQLGQLKIILKQELGKVPFFGWAMQSCMFIFLCRDSGKDIPHIKAMLDYFAQASWPTTLLIFPEGTDLSASNLAKAKQYAKEKKLTQYEQLLQPKLAGFKHCIQRLAPALDAVYDVSIAYDRFEGERPSEVSLFKGRNPHSVHMHLQRTSIGAMPTGDEDLTKWIRASWADKEERLTEFYTTVPRKLFRDGRPWAPKRWVYLRYLLATLFFLAVAALAVYGLRQCLWVRWYAAAAVVSWAWLSSVGGATKGILAS
ncbi:unnamed protein product [Chrysoparadoxa australica]